MINAASKIPKYFSMQYFLAPSIQGTLSLVANLVTTLNPCPMNIYLQIHNDLLVVSNKRFYFEIPGLKEIAIRGKLTPFAWSKCYEYL